MNPLKRPCAELLEQSLGHEEKESISRSRKATGYGKKRRGRRARAEENDGYRPVKFDRGSRSVGGFREGSAKKSWFV